MRFAFITPSFHTLGPAWRRDPQIVKLGAPQIAGALYAHGFHDIREYDFEVELFDLEWKTPGRLNLRVFFDDSKVDEFLSGKPVPEIRAQCELILSTIEVQEADLFAFSCASVLEIYADMHAAGNLNMCLAMVLKERFPKCLTVIGGLKISPNTKHRPELEQMLVRCSVLDYAAEGLGEAALLQIVDHVTRGFSFEDLGREAVRINNGWLLVNASARELRINPTLAREEGLKIKNGFVPITDPVESIMPKDGQKLTTLNVPFSSTTALVLASIEAKRKKPMDDEGTEFGPQGDHERKALFNPSIFVTPYFDKQNIDRRKISGGELMDRYHLRGTQWEAKLCHHHSDKVALLPYIFMEGCNARCAFCAYSMTKMVKRDVDEVVRSIAWMREKYDVRYFHFLNTNINGSMQYAEAFCDALIDAKLDILWSDCANLWALNERLLEKLRKSGCVRFTYGVECPSDRMLDYIGKGITVKQALARLKQASDMGIWNQLLLITGLPTETDEDTKHFIDFLEQSSEHANAYSISSFYLISSSLMGAFPHRYGLEMMPNPSGLLEDSGFNEIGGLPWDKKKRQIIKSTEVITNAIKRIKVDPKYWSGSIDLELIFWLYDKFGHDNKKDIVACYEDAFLGSPAHPKSYRSHIQELVQKREGPIEILSRAGMSVDPAGIQLREEAVIIPVDANGNRIDVELRCLAHGGKPSLSAGRNLGVSAKVELAFEDALKEVIAPDSELDKAVVKSGWKITDRNISRELMGRGFRMELGNRGLDVFVKTVGPNERAFLKSGNLGMAYSVAPNMADPTSDPRMMPFLQQIGRYMLDRLQRDPRAAQAGYADASALKDFADDLVHVLEETYATELDCEPLHENAKLTGRRHGDKFSRVATG